VYVPLDSSAQDTALADMDERSSPRSADSSKSHKLRKGETLASLAKQYGVSQADILKANGFNKPSQVATGKTIVIPAKAAACPPVQPKVQVAESKTVEMKKGLTLAAVAAANKVDVKTLMVANGLKSEKDLKAGMKLRIPGEPAPAPVQAERPAAAGKGQLAATDKTATKPAEPAKGPRDKDAKNSGRAAKEAAKPEPKQVASSQPTSAAKDAKTAPKTAEQTKSESAKDAKSSAKPVEQAKDAKKPSGPIHYSVENGVPVLEDVAANREPRTARLNRVKHH
jgi:membrane-bound lytic murein transglycosylase D